MPVTRRGLLLSLLKKNRDEDESHKAGAHEEQSPEDGLSGDKAKASWTHLLMGEKSHGFVRMLTVQCVQCPHDRIGYRYSKRQGEKCPTAN